MAEKNLGEQDVTAIDKALAAAKARKDAKLAAGITTPSKTREPKSDTGSSEPKRPKVSEEERATRQIKLDEERAARRASRDVTRQEKLIQRNAAKKPAHMRKVQKAAEKMSPLGPSAELLFNEATTNLSAAEIAILGQHLQHFNRVKATERALEQKIVEGASVSIVSGDPRFVGKTGTVVKAQRIRCYVNIEGANNRPVPGTDANGIYFFTSDVTPVEIEAEIEQPEPEAVSVA